MMSLPTSWKRIWEQGLRRFFAKQSEAQSKESPDSQKSAPSSPLPAVAPFGVSPQPQPQSWPTLPSSLDEETEQARRILAIAVSRQATRFVTQATVSRVLLGHQQLKEGIKSRIVGKEGRNVRHFEERAGVDLLLNEEPHSVLVSSFDPFRREVARVALEKLVRDGRIHPARIEEVLVEAKKEVEDGVRSAGTKAVAELQLQNVHPAIVRILGTLKFRSSFGQNQLEHSIESAWLCGHLAKELGFDSLLARRAALLHDLGKALDQTHDAGHALAGAEFAKRYGEDSQVVRAIAAHHEEILPETWLDHLVIAADALSGARPGARKGSTEQVLERARQMEKIAGEIPGVSASYAVQAGRELRVFVDSEKISDLAVREVARQITQRIQEELSFPGQIKVTVLREMRVTEVVSR